MSIHFPLTSGMRHGIAARSMIGSVLFALLLFLCNQPAPVQARARLTVWSVNPVADGTVTDSNRDRVGDALLDGQNSVVVGFNALGPGEHRGVYEFDLRSAPPVRYNARVVVFLNRTGTRMNGTSDRLTLYAGSGDGALSAADYSAGRFVRAFESRELGPAADWYDNQIDVTGVVRRLAHRGAGYLVIVIRPDPRARAGQGAILFSSNEIADIDQFAPAKLTIQIGR